MEARYGCKWRQGGLNVLFLKEGRCETRLGSSLTHRLGIKHPFLSCFKPLCARLSGRLSPAVTRKTRAADFDNTFELLFFFFFFANATCFPVSAVLRALRCQAVKLGRTSRGTAAFAGALAEFWRFQLRPGTTLGILFSLLFIRSRRLGS